jgi:predicted negative regulator of RcsB-dependent stress response
MMMIMMMMIIIMIIIIIIIIIMYCNIFGWQYWPTVGTELSGRPADPDYQGTTELSTAMETISVINGS